MLSGIGEFCWDGPCDYTGQSVTDPIGNGKGVSVRGLPRLIPNREFRARPFQSRTQQSALPHVKLPHPSFHEVIDVDIAVKDAGFRCVIPQDDGHQFFENIVPVLLPGAPRLQDSESDWNTKRWLDFRKGLGEAELEQLIDVIMEKVKASRGS